MGESYKLWIEREDRTDDITIIVGFIEQSGAKRDPGVGVEEVAIEEGGRDEEEEDAPRVARGQGAAPRGLSIRRPCLASDFRFS